jgi:hypothetical protein
MSCNLLTRDSLPIAQEGVLYHSRQTEDKQAAGAIS